MVSQHPEDEGIPLKVVCNPSKSPALLVRDVVATWGCPLTRTHSTVRVTGKGISPMFPRKAMWPWDSEYILAEQQKTKIKGAKELLPTPRSLNHLNIREEKGIVGHLLRLRHRKAQSKNAKLSNILNQWEKQSNGDWLRPCVKPEITTHGCPIKSSCIVGCIQAWPASCLTLSHKWDSSPCWPLKVPFIGGGRRCSEERVLAVIHC